MGHREGGSFTEFHSVRDSYTVFDGPSWGCRTDIVDNYKADCPVSGHRKGEVVSQTVFGNTLMSGGMSAIWQRFITLDPTTSATGGALQAMSSGNAAIGVGDSTLAVTSTQQDLLAAASSTSRYISGMSSAGSPNHTDGVGTTANRQLTLKGSWSTLQGNFAWEEWGVFTDPHTTAAGAAWGLGRMVNRKLQALGTKSSSATRTMTVTLSVS